MSDRARTAAEVEATAHLGRIAALKLTPGWDDLTVEIEAAEERFWRRFRSDLQGGKPVDQRELDFMLGKFAAGKAILNQPDRAVRKLDKEASDSED